MTTRRSGLHRRTARRRWPSGVLFPGGRRVRTSTSDVGASPVTVYLRALGPLEIRDARGEDPRALLVQPKRLALLAYIALNGPATLHQREKLCGMFWPDSAEDLARLSLRQALHFLRRATGSDVIESKFGNEIRIRADALRTDLADFETAIAEQRRADAIALYRGEFLEGFHVAGVSSEFEWWLDRQRTAIADTKPSRSGRQR